MKQLRRQFTFEVKKGIDPRSFVATCGYTLDKGWKFLGPEFGRGDKTYHARLIDLGEVESLADARDKAFKGGFRLLEGQASKSFMTTYSCNPSIRQTRNIEGELLWEDVSYPSYLERPIVFGGCEWESTSRSLLEIYRRAVPCLIGTRTRTSFLAEVNRRPYNVCFNHQWQLIMTPTRTLHGDKLLWMAVKKEQM